jgi:uncharacterized protein
MIGLVVVTAVLSTSVPTKPTDVVAETKAWHDRRISRLTAEDGWLSLVGLHWLQEGENTVGSANKARVKLPKSAPEKVGVFTRKGQVVTFQPQKGVEVRLKDQPFTGGEVKSDAAEGGPDELRVGGLRFFVIARGEKLGVRVKDPEAKTRKEFHGISTYPADAKWRVRAKFTPAKTPVMVPVPTVQGTVEQMPSPGTLEVTLEGKPYTLIPVDEGDGRLFIIFGDLTNKTETYGAGRFLYAEPAKNGETVVDFNQAYNPPCAFTPYATCPLPPKENKLALPIPAGEKRYGDH